MNQLGDLRYLRPGASAHVGDNFFSNPLMSVDIDDRRVEYIKFPFLAS